MDYGKSNAFVAGYGVLLPTNNVIFLTNSPSYQSGALGSYYYPTGYRLIQAGDRSAASVPPGLYHYTTVTTANNVDGTNTVSIGLHYVGVDANGNPLDTNGDGIPDYLQDANGNGKIDSGETSWTNIDLGLQVWITEPANNSKLP